MNYYKKKETFKLVNYIHLISSIYFYSTNVNYNTKHYVPANKEWKDSAYSYNKNYLKLLPVYNNISNNLIISHFNLTNLKNIARSKRMRNLIMKKSNKKIFISKPYIKHSNDKTIVNIYTFNRQKQFLMRKLYFYKRKYNLFKQWMNNALVKTIKVNKDMLKNTLKRKYFQHITTKQKKLFNRRTRKRIPYNGISYKNELHYLRYRTLNIYKKLLYFNNIFIFMFFRKLLYLFNINLFLPILDESLITNKKNTMYTKKIFKNSNKNIFVKNALRKILLNKPNKLMWLNKTTNLLNLANKDFLTETLIRSIIFKNSYNYNDLILMNKRIFYYIENRFIKEGIIDKSYIVDMYIKFKIKYYKELVFKFFKEESTILYYLNSLELNILKFTKLLCNLKIMINKIYNKDIELNITNLKYPFLNSDIYTKVIINKAERNMTMKKLLSLSLTLSSMPKEISNRQFDDVNYNINNKLSPDNLENIYKTNFINKNSIVEKHSNKGINKTADILTTIKFKWVTGIWLQAAGRLTRRNTASRSSVNTKHKGNLKNEKYYVKNGELKAVSSAVIRNTFKSNSQYTYIGSKRRIGSFGMKSWISSY